MHEINFVYDGSFRLLAGWHKVVTILTNELTFKQN